MGAIFGSLIRLLLKIDLSLCSIEPIHAIADVQIYRRMSGR